MGRHSFLTACPMGGVLNGTANFLDRLVNARAHWLTVVKNILGTWIFLWGMSYNMCCVVMNILHLLDRQMLNVSYSSLPQKAILTFAWIKFTFLIFSLRSPYYLKRKSKVHKNSKEKPDSRFWNENARLSWNLKSLKGKFPEFSDELLANVHWIFLKETRM
jgi:hypothetical protein